MKNQLLVSEMFGPTLQGEGRSVGQQACFLRLGGCNLRCIWCDSAFTWRFNDVYPHKSDQVFDKGKELTQMSFNSIFETLTTFANCELLVITGGEPLLQRDNLYDFLEEIKHRYNHQHTIEKVEFETAGTIPPGRLSRYGWVSFNVSPKLKNSGNPYHERFNKDALESFAATGRAIFKFVVTSEADFEEIAIMMSPLEIKPSQIWIMAEGEKTEDQYRNMGWVAQGAIERGYNFSPRLHTLIWGNKRAV